MNLLPPFSIHLITSRVRLAPEAATVSQEVAALERQLDEAIDAGVDIIHIRERDLEGRVLADLVSRVVGRAAETRTRVIVNERADVAKMAAAAGVHLPSAGCSGRRVRDLEPTWIIGRSIHGNDDPVDRAACDYLLFGTVFGSESKPGATTSGIEGLARAAGRFEQPVIALGGVTPARVAACVAAGAGGVAAIGAFLPPGRAVDAGGTRQAVARFREAVAVRQP